MATNERSRHELYGKLEEVLGPVHTDTLMDHLPPGGWSDVATRQDLRHLDGKIDHLDSKIGHLGSKVDHLAGRVDELDHKSGLLDSKIDLLAGRVDGLAGEVNGLRGDMQVLEARVMSRIHRALWMQTAALLVVVLGALATALVGLAGL